MNSAEMQMEKRVRLYDRILRKIYEFLNYKCREYIVRRKCSETCLHLNCVFAFAFRRIQEVTPAECVFLRGLREKNSWWREKKEET